MTEQFTTHEEPVTDESWPWELLLLHGTGGNERDLIPLGSILAPGIGMLGIRGQVNEGGALRFFRRFSEGQLDLEDLRAKADALATFLRLRRDAARGKSKPLMIVGYSNGANMGTALLQVAPELFAGGILLRAMWSLAVEPKPRLDAQSILLLNGVSDPLVSADQLYRLHEFLAQCGATAVLKITRSSHQLTDEDIELASDWLRKQKERSTHASE